MTSESVERGTSRGRAFGIACVEIALIFGIFVCYGAWPTPDVNEQYYIGKAIHFWNPNWLAADPFLNTPDSHWLFYATFGLLSLVFSQTATVWIGRALVWLLTALAWRRLSRALLPVDGLAVVTALAFAFYLESFHLAGEWIIGGVEGKSFAFPLVFWGLACFLEGKYNRAWILYGLGSAFHALVGGWAVLASLLAGGMAFVARLFSRRGGESTSLRASVKKFVNMTPGLFLGGAISLLGVIPALRLDAGASAAVIDASRRIYVFKRLAHHLVASSLPWTFLTRFGLLTLAFFLAGALVALFLRRARRSGLALASFDSGENAQETAAKFARLRRFVVASILVACVGLVCDFGAKYLGACGKLDDPQRVAHILRYYWYRLSDWVVPLGFVFFSTRLLANLWFAYGRRTLDRFGATVGRLGAELAALGAVYWGAKFAFVRIAERVAASEVVEGSAIIPKPTTDVSLMATIVAFGVCLLLILVVAAVRRSDGADGREKGTALAVPTALLLWTSLIVLLAPTARLAYFVDLRGTKVIPRSEPPKESIADGWRDCCHWVAENTPEDAIFLAPRGCDSFKWLAKRAEAGSWKEIPQDAKSIVEWNRKMEVFYANPGAPEDSPLRWNQALNVVFINKGRDQILAESREEGYDYAILESATYAVFANKEATRRWNEFIDADAVFQNQQFVVLKLNKSK